MIEQGGAQRQHPRRSASLRLRWARTAGAFTVVLALVAGLLFLERTDTGPATLGPTQALAAAQAARAPDGVATEPDPVAERPRDHPPEDPPHSPEQAEAAALDALHQLDSFDPDHPRCRDIRHALRVAIADVERAIHDLERNGGDPHVIGRLQQLLVHLRQGLERLALHCRPPSP